MAFTFGDAFADQREQEWRRAGATEQDISWSRQSGMDARDVAALRVTTLAQSLCIVIRCPKATARIWHGILPPKNVATKEKTNAAGVMQGNKGRLLMVSDYDLMSVWRGPASAQVKVFISAAKGASRGAWSTEAVALIRMLNGKLVSRLQHGCQDDFESTDNPGVKSGDHFIAFNRGAVTYLANREACAKYYVDAGLGKWPYDASGKFSGRVHGK